MYTYTSLACEYTFVSIHKNIYSSAKRCLTCLRAMRAQSNDAWECQPRVGSFSRVPESVSHPVVNFIDRKYSLTDQGPCMAINTLSHECWCDVLFPSRCLYCTLSIVPVGRAAAVPKHLWFPTGGSRFCCRDTSFFLIRVFLCFCCLCL